ASEWISSVMPRSVPRSGPVKKTPEVYNRPSPAAELLFSGRGKEHAGLERPPGERREADEPAHLAHEAVGVAERPGGGALQDALLIGGRQRAVVREPEHQEVALHLARLRAQQDRFLLAARDDRRAARAEGGEAGEERHRGLAQLGRGTARQRGAGGHAD